ncbi:uncharacterized protein CLUP02_15881 [Colletotrichum lupini]|uniref:Uncharacterized protein n=1 Tax=Colletotrichum lupini TaxID=145971 RepID=A0A9Q8WP51_9PEZI|nr:uncharacterized protein CLUP02_15881 [Colletotrichum lupini]UQC90351.1 hypothetical protein CLUP02_15881 [Colletotrichum lupini]
MPANSYEVSLSSVAQSALWWSKKYSMGHRGSHNSPLGSTTNLSARHVTNTLQVSIRGVRRSAVPSRRSHSWFLFSRSLSLPHTFSSCTDVPENCDLPQSRELILDQLEAWYLRSSVGSPRGGVGLFSLLGFSADQTLLTSARPVDKFSSGCRLNGQALLRVTLDQGHRLQLVRIVAQRHVPPSSAIWL